MAKKQPAGPASIDDEDERGSWHLRSGGAWVFGIVLWLAGVGGVVLFSRDGAEVALAHWHGVEGTVAIQTCAHTRSYALCYGPFEAKNGSVHRKRIELRTTRHDNPGRDERAWLPRGSASYAWAADVGAGQQLIPAAPFALLAIIQTWWLTSSLRAWLRRRRLPRMRKQTPWAGGELGQPAPPDVFGAAPPGYPQVPAGPYPPIPTSGGHLPPGADPPGPAPSTDYPGNDFPTAVYPATGRVSAPDLVPPSTGRVYRSDPIEPEYRQPQHPPGWHTSSGGAGGADGAGDGWQDRRGTAAPPAPSVPQPRARRPYLEKPDHG